MYTLLKNGQRNINPALVIIHYFGFLDSMINTPHRNRKIKDPENIMPFVMTARSELIT